MLDSILAACARSRTQKAQNKYEMVHCDHNPRLFIRMLQIKGLVSWKQLLHLESSAAWWEVKEW